MQGISVIKVGIVGGSGYTGVELLRLLAQHPQVELHAITSRADAGTPVSQMFPSLRGYVDLPEHWRYSSARNYLGQPGLVHVVTDWA